MPSIILPSHLRRQPGQLLQPVDGIESVLNYGVPGYGLVQGRPVARGTLTAGWTALTAKGVGSLAGYTQGSSKYLGGLTVPSLPTARFYLAWYVNLVRGAGASQAQTLFSASGTFGSSTVCQIVPASTGIVLTFVHTHDYTTRLSLSHTFTGDPGWGLLEAKGDGTTVGLYFNGTLLTSGAPSAWYNHTNTPELCLRAIDWAYTVSVVLAVASRRHLPNTKQYVDNPWSVFRPRRRVLYFETAGGGTSQVTSDLADSYAIRSAVSQDCADSYAIRSAVSQDLADAYTLRALASGDLADSYAIRAAIAQDLSDAYDIQVAGAVASDLADTYAVRAAVAQDAADAYAIRAAVQASLADAYAVNAAVQASLADAYAIITAASADLEDGYVIRAQAVADLIDSYAVFAGVGGGSCPSAAEIAAAVRAELAAELANMDASVSGVPAAVWAHNLP